MLVLHIGNKNYSSWSLRPWVLLRELGITFEERLHPFAQGEDFSRFSPSAKVPCLVAGEVVVWDSLAIAEWVAEHHAGVWPSDPIARAWARSAAAEMHSGFAALRSICSMNCGVRVELHAGEQARLATDLARIEALFADGLTRFGGPWLAGDRFGAVDAFFTPIAFRVQTYGLTLGEPAGGLISRMLELPSMRSWYADAIREPWRDPDHEVDLDRAGVVTHDYRAGVAGIA